MLCNVFVCEILATATRSFNLLPFIFTKAEVARVGHDFSKVSNNIKKLYLSLYLYTCSGIKRLVQVELYRFCVRITALVSNSKRHCMSCFFLRMDDEVIPDLKN